MICTVTKCYSGDEIKENELERANGACGGEQRCIQGFGGKA
jgi:hypothetical protein